MKNSIFFCYFVRTGGVNWQVETDRITTLEANRYAVPVHGSGLMVLVEWLVVGK